MAARPASPPAPTARAASAVELAARCSTPRDLPIEERLALGRGDGDRHDRLHVGQCGAGPAQQALLHVEDDLALDEELVVEGQGVLGQAHRAVDGVLDRHEPEIGHAGLHRPQDIGDGGQVDELAGSQIGLREQGLLGEGAGRPEVADPHPCWTIGHRLAG